MSDVEHNLSFIDTNVWLYAFIQNQDQGKTVRAKEVIRHSAVIISSQVINEVCVNLIRKAHFDEAGIRNLIESFYNKYQVANVNHVTLIKASQMRERYRFSYWDSLIVSSALTEGATLIYSEDMQGGLKVENQLQIINPFADSGNAV